MRAISLGDTLYVERADRDSMSCTDPDLPSDSTNLVLKAARLFREKSKIDLHCRFRLIKRVPTQAGLGGGSSNAATALWALSQIAGQKIDLQELMEWSAELGSDVPFFFSLGSAYCTGRGELVKEKEGMAPLSFWIAKPASQLSTPKVYKNLNLKLLPERASLKAGDCSHYYNDLEQAAFLLEPSLITLKERLLQLGFQTVVMTGSGTAFFCLGPIQNPKIEGVQFYPATTIQRETGRWYL